MDFNSTSSVLSSTLFHFFLLNLELIIVILVQNMHNREPFGYAELEKQKLRRVSCAQTHTPCSFTHSVRSIFALLVFDSCDVFGSPHSIYFHVDFVSIFPPISLWLCRIRSNLIRKFTEAPHSLSANVVSAWRHSIIKINYRTNEYCFSFLFSQLQFFRRVKIIPSQKVDPTKFRKALIRKK